MEAALIARLEKAVERLEKLEVNVASKPAASAPSGVPAPAAPSASTPAPAAVGAASALADWDSLMSAHFGPVKALVPHLPQEAQQSMQSFERAFQATRRVLEVAAVAKKPEGPSELQQLLAPVAEAMGEVAAAAEARRVSCPHHLKVLSESAGALNFLAYSGPGCGLSLPRQQVVDSWQAAEFFANKVLMEARGRDENQVAWVRGMKSFMQQLEQLVSRHCATGLRFDPAGLPLQTALLAGPANGPAPAAAAAAPAAPAAPAPRKGAPPPPPPPGPPPKPLTAEELGLAGPGSRSGGGAAAGGGGGGGDMSALFKELSKGEGITSGLRRVTADMKAKNRPDRSGAVPGTTAATAAPASTSSGGAGGRGGQQQPTGTPKLELQGSKWVVEHHVGRGDLQLTNEAPKNSVYVYGCRDCVLQIHGKVNAISLDKCVRVGVVFGEVIAVAEAVNCTSVQLQVTGSVPTLSIEKTDGAQLFVSRRCAADPNFQVVTAKCSAVNVVVIPGGGGEEGAGGQPEEAEPEDPREHAVPEQFISTFQGGKLVTVAAAHSGA